MQEPPDARIGAQRLSGEHREAEAERSAEDAQRETFTDHERHDAPAGPADGAHHAELARALEEREQHRVRDDDGSDHEGEDGRPAIRGAEQLEAPVDAAELRLAAHRRQRRMLDLDVMTQLVGLRAGRPRLGLHEQQGELAVLVLDALERGERQHDRRVARRLIDAVDAGDRVVVVFEGDRVADRLAEILGSAPAEHRLVAGRRRERPSGQHPHAERLELARVDADLDEDRMVGVEVGGGDERADQRADPR